MSLPHDEQPHQANYYPADKPRKRGTQAVILIIAIAVLVVGGWWGSQQSKQQPIVVVEQPKPVLEQPMPVPAAQPEVPDTVEQPAVITQIVEAPAAVKLPSLEYSDDFVRETWQNLSNHADDSAQDYSDWLNSDNLIRRATAITDGLSRGQLLQKFIPESSPDGTFAVSKQGQAVTVSPDNYQRYEATVEKLIAVEPEKMVETLNQLQPLLENAFAEQGYPDRTYQDALVEAIDELLATPSFELPPELVLESVNYTFKDPQLEALSQVQKQLIRSGPENTRILQEYLKKLKEHL